MHLRRGRINAAEKKSGNGMKSDPAFSVPGCFALAAADPVDMPFKIPAADQFRQHILLKGGNGTTVKSHTELKYREQGPGKHHVSDT